MIIDLLRDTILSNIGQLKPAPNNWQKRNCMLCHLKGQGKDSRSRFGMHIDSDSIVIHCFNCGFSATYKNGQYLSKNFKIFLEEIGIGKKFISTLEFEIFKTKNGVGSNYEIAKISEKALSQWRPMELPDGARTIEEHLANGCMNEDFLRVVEYGMKRNIPYIERLYWSPDETNNLHNRLIIPYYYKNEIVGYTARLAIKEEHIPRYYQRCPHDFIYNLDSQHNENKYVIVTEGVIDAMLIGGVSTLGSNVSENKVNIIKKLHKTVIVNPDLDKNGYELVKIAVQNGWAVSLPKWDIGIKDAAQAVLRYGKLLTTFSIIDSAITDPLKIELLWDVRFNEMKRNLK